MLILNSIYKTAYCVGIEYIIKEICTLSPDLCIDNSGDILYNNINKTRGGNRIC